MLLRAVTRVQEPLGGACSTTVITNIRVGDFEGSAFVLDFAQTFKRIITFPVQNDGNLIGLMARIRQRIGFLQEQGKLASGGAGGGTASAGHSAAEVQMLLLRLHDMEGKVRCFCGIGEPLLHCLLPFDSASDHP